MNSDFMRTLIAMKLRSGRKYKNDLSDIIGILAERDNRGNAISKDKIDAAVFNLYGSWDGFSVDFVSFINDAMERGTMEPFMRRSWRKKRIPRIYWFSLEKNIPVLQRSPM